MEFTEIEIDKTNPAKIFLFDDIQHKFDLTGEFTLDISRKKGVKIDQIDIEVTNDTFNRIHQLKNAIICDRVFQDNRSYYALIINLEIVADNGSSPPQTPFSFKPKKIFLDSGTLIHVILNFINNPGNPEIKKCRDFDPLSMNFTPDHANGNIIVSSR